jgi:hypothetical protein
MQAMQLRTTTVKKNSKYLFFALMSLELIFVIIYLWGILTTGKSYAAFDLNGLRTIPSLFSAVQLFGLGFVLVALAFYPPQANRQPSRRLLLTLGGIILYISVDEVFKLHQLFYKPLCWLPFIEKCRQFAQIWIYVYIAIAFLTIAILAKDLIASWRFYPQGALLAGIGIFTFLFGGMGLELIKYDFLQPIMLMFFDYNDAKFILIEKLRIAVEEFLEMFGVSIALYSLGLILARRLELVNPPRF